MLFLFLAFAVLPVSLTTGQKAFGMKPKVDVHLTIKRIDESLNVPLRPINLYLKRLNKLETFDWNRKQNSHVCMLGKT